jgi:hypothetical protein
MGRSGGVFPAPRRTPLVQLVLVALIAVGLAVVMLGSVLALRHLPPTAGGSGPALVAAREARQRQQHDAEYRNVPDHQPFKQEQRAAKDQGEAGLVSEHGNDRSGDEEKHNMQVATETPSLPPHTNKQVFLPRLSTLLRRSALGRKASSIDSEEALTAFDGRLVSITILPREDKPQPPFETEEPMANFLLHLSTVNRTASASPYRGLFELRVVKGGAFTLMSEARTYLSVDIDGGVAIDRLEAKSFERWSAVFLPGRVTHLVAHDGRFLCYDRVRAHRLGTCSDGGGPTVLRIRLLGYASPASFGDAQHFPLELGVAPPDIGESTGSNTSGVLLVSTLAPLSKMHPIRRQFQLQTLQNWASLKPFVHPFVCIENDDDTIAELTRVGIDYGTNCETNEQFLLPTYRGMFTKALYEATRRRVTFQTTEGVTGTRILMMTNADIHFTVESLSATITSVVNYVARMPEVDSFLIVGRRKNCDSVSNALDAHGRIQLAAAEPGTPAKCVLFSEVAQDYFVVSERLIADWSRVPPLVAGGVAFDNWLVSNANARRNAVVVDASATLVALHQNHGAGLYDSHKAPKSEYNSKLAHEAGGWFLGKISLAPYMTVPIINEQSNTTTVHLHERYVVVCGDYLTDAAVVPKGIEFQMPRSDDCYTHHWSQLGLTEPPNAFKRAWVRSD